LTFVKITLVYVISSDDTSEKSLERFLASNLCEDFSSQAPRMTRNDYVISSDSEKSTLIADGKVLVGRISRRKLL